MPDFRGINYHSPTTGAFGRRISGWDSDVYRKEREQDLESMDEAALVQTGQREPGSFKYDHYDEIDYTPSQDKDGSSGCYRPKWSYALKP